MVDKGPHPVNVVLGNGGDKVFLGGVDNPEDFPSFFQVGSGQLFYMGSNHRAAGGRSDAQGGHFLLFLPQSGLLGLFFVLEHLHCRQVTTVVGDSCLEPCPAHFQLQGAQGGAAFRVVENEQGLPLCDLFTIPDKNFSDKTIGLCFDAILVLIFDNRRRPDGSFPAHGDQKDSGYAGQDKGAQQEVACDMRIHCFVARPAGNKAVQGHDDPDQESSQRDQYTQAAEKLGCHIAQRGQDQKAPDIDHDPVHTNEQPFSFGHAGHR